MDKNKIIERQIERLESIQLDAIKLRDYITVVNAGSLIKDLISLKVEE